MKDKTNNNLSIVYPEIAALLLDPKEGYNLSKCSGEKAIFKCPNCGCISQHIVANVVRRGFSCPVCSDGISYPNKFMANMLFQLKVNFKHEFSYNDSKYRYDFYLNDFNIIIEMHGRQHYEGWGKSCRTLEEEKENDKDKMAFAISKGISKYIVIDSKCSDINYISNNILKSDLINVFDLSEVDWRQCGYYASGSLVHKCAELYNNGYNTLEISNILLCSDVTVRRFLKKATSIGLCNYVPNKGFLKDPRKIILLNTKEIFDSLGCASRFYNVSFQNISKNCKRQRSYAGFDITTGQPLVWRFLDEYDENEVIDFNSLINPRIKYNNTKLI